MGKRVLDRNSPEFEQMEALVWEVYRFCVGRAVNDNQVLSCFISCLFTSIRGLSEVGAGEMGEMLRVSHEALDEMYREYLGVNGGVD